MNAAKLRHFFLDDWALKSISLLFAVLLWAFVVGEKRSEVSLSVPLELTGVGDDMVVVSRVPDSIRVRLSGSRTVLESANPQALTVILDLQGIQPGISSFEILPSRLDLPRGVEVTYISPSVVTLEADVKFRKAIPVRPRIKGTPAEGFEVAEARANPAEIEVEGPERVIKQVREIPTEVVDVTGMDGSLTRPVELALPDPTIRPTEKRPMQLEVVIREMRAEREFSDVPVRPPAPDWAVVPAGVNVKLEGSFRVMSRLNAADLTAQLEVPAGQLTKSALRVKIVGPPGVRVVAISPDRAEAIPPAQRPESGSGARVDGG